MPGILSYGLWFAIGLLAIAAIFLLALAFFEGVREGVKEWGKSLVRFLSAPGGDFTRIYLEKFIEDYRATHPYFFPARRL